MTLQFETRLTACLLAAGALFCGVAWGEDEQLASTPIESGPATAPNDKVMAEHGRSLYAHHCSHCHGFNMVNPGTVSFDLRQFPHNDKARFLNSVTNGKNGRMPPWNGVLTPQELDEIWSYILTGGKS